MTVIDLNVAREYYQKREARKRVQREVERQRWLKQVREAAPRLAARYPQIRRVYLFGSIVQPGRFRDDSDIDLAVAYDVVTYESIAAESAFWREMERELKRDVDVRPFTGVIAEIAINQGEKIYG